MSAPSSGPPTARSVAPRLRFGIPSLDAMFVEAIPEERATVTRT